MEKQFEELMVASLYKYPEHSIASGFLAEFTYPWEALETLTEFIRRIGPTLPQEEYEMRGENVWISKHATVAPTAFIGGPCIIGAGAEIRHCAFIRRDAIVGEGAVVGNSTELKNCILYDRVQVPHLNFVGDSIFGYRAHMGAGAVTSNVKSDYSPITVNYFGEKVPTGRIKQGSMLGDFAEIGCQCVLNPGTVVGEHSNVYPLTAVRGYVPANSIVKSKDCIVPKRQSKL